MTLPIALLIEKNKLNTKYPWLLLLKITLYEGESNEFELRFVRDYKDITFKNELYKNFNFSVGIIKQDIEGSVPTTFLGVCNVSQYLQPYMEEQDGLVDATITITIVHAEHLTEDYSEVELVFDVLSSYVNAGVVMMQVGCISPLRQRYPLDRFFSDLCGNKFKGVKCGYTGSDTECKRRFSDCRAKNNSARFGNCPGLKAESIRLA